MAVDFNGSDQALYRSDSVVTSVGAGESVYYYGWCQPDDIITNQYWGGSSNSKSLILGYQNGNWNIFHYPTGTAGDTQMSAIQDVWQCVIYTTDGSTLKGYVGTSELVSLSDDLPSGGQDQYIGMADLGKDYYNGKIGYYARGVGFDVIGSKANALARGVNPFAFGVSDSFIVFVYDPDDSQIWGGTLTDRSLIKEGSPTKTSSNPPVELIETYL